MVGPATIYPNPDIRDGKSWSTEIGVKKRFRIGKNWKGFCGM